MSYPKCQAVAKRKFVFLRLSNACNSTFNLQAMPFFSIFFWKSTLRVCTFYPPEGVLRTKKIFMKRILIVAVAGLLVVACNNEKTADTTKTSKDTTDLAKD